MHFSSERRDKTPISLVIGKCNHLVLAFGTPNFGQSKRVNLYIINNRKRKVVWEAVKSLFIASRPKTAVQKASRIVKTDVLIPVVVELLPRFFKLD